MWEAGSIAFRWPELHRKVFYLVGVGMFFEGFDIYIAASVLGATYKTGFSTLAENGLFISISTFAFR
jgi:MFS transporter, putative metabolite:H+ symporter